VSFDGPSNNLTSPLTFIKVELVRGGYGREAVDYGVALAMLTFMARTPFKDITAIDLSAAAQRGLPPNDYDVRRTFTHHVIRDHSLDRGPGDLGVHEIVLLSSLGDPIEVRRADVPTFVAAFALVGDLAAPLCNLFLDSRDLEAAFAKSRCGWVRIARYLPPSLEPSDPLFLPCNYGERVMTWLWKQLWLGG
jgi:hypothetical protein